MINSSQSPAGISLEQSEEAASQLQEMVSVLGLREPTTEQAQVAVYPPTIDGNSAPLLVVAGAGSGKTETISLRATYLSAYYGIPPEAILGLTFTRKAAGELAERLTDRLSQWDLYKQGGVQQTRDPFSGIPVATTYNSFALQVVKEYGIAAGINPESEHLSQGASWQLMNEIVSGWTSDLLTELAVGTVTSRALQLREAIANQALSLGEAKAALKRFSQVLESEEKLTGFIKDGISANQQRLALIEVIEEFERRKVEQGRMDFTDQVQAALKIVTEVPAAREELRERYQVVFLDEFQDTSVLQLKFLSRLFQNHPVTAVGDPNQAIYGWRGASSGSLSAFHNYFNPLLKEQTSLEAGQNSPEQSLPPKGRESSPNGQKRAGQAYKRRRLAPATILQLSTAWRNDQLILDVANRISSPLNTSQVGACPTIEVSLLNPRPEVEPGMVEATYFKRPEAELEYVVNCVQTSRRELGGEQGSGSVAVLARTKVALTKIYEALIDAGIPAQLSGSDSLLMNPVIADLRAALQIASDAGRSAPLVRLLYNLDFGAADLWALGRWAADCKRRAVEAKWENTDNCGELDEREESPWQLKPQREILLQEALEEAASLDGKTRAEQFGMSQAAFLRIKLLGERLRQLRKVSDRTITGQIEYARRLFHFEEEMLATYPQSNVGEVLDLFISVASDYEESADRPTLIGFLEMLDASEEQNETISLPTVSPDPNAVQVMTIHASKGLEWDAVIVADLAEGIFPNHRGKHGGYSKKEGTMEAPPPVPGQLGWWEQTGELPYPVRADRDYLPALDWDPTETSTKRREYLREQIGQYLLNEERRLAYVAFTRARHRLYLSGAWVRTFPTSPRYPGLFFREAQEVAGVEARVEDYPQTLEEAQKEEVIADTADFPVKPSTARKRVKQSAAKVQDELQAWDKKMSLVEAKKIFDRLELPLSADQIVMLLQESQEGRQQSRRTLPRGRQTWKFSVSELAKAQKDPEKFIEEALRPIPENSFVATNFGTLVHKWIEDQLRVWQLNGSEIAGTVTLESKPEPVPAELIQLDEAEQRKFIARQRAFRQLEFLRYPVEAVEWPFTVEIEKLLIRGRIDAVFKTGGQYFLVDWKTSNIDVKKLLKKQPADKEVRGYYTQLSIYQRAWAEIRQVEPEKIQTQLVFLQDTGSQIVTLAELESQLSETDKELIASELIRGRE